MRLLYFLLASILGLGWIMLLDKPLGELPAFGRLLDPVSGFWGNAEPVKTPPFTLPVHRYTKSVKVRMDERLVPHITAPSDEALYFTQGYLHARYRLWQMDMQTRVAAGRLSEVAGNKAFDLDRLQRRKGMLWAAENSLRAMERDPLTRRILDAYTMGVNTYIQELRYRDFPLEYKLMGFEPEAWTNLKCALILKLMADDLTGKVNDIAMSYLREQLSTEEFNKLYPEFIEDSKPVIPAGTRFAPPSLHSLPAPGSQVFATFPLKDSNLTIERGKAGMQYEAEDQLAKGSNNWVIAPQLTTDSAAILCSDPHLGLHLPAIWYEIQLTAPGINCYGVSIPGTPGITIGFNDNIAWGMTNNYRDVKDYYEIRSEDPRLYYFDGKEVPFNERIELIHIRGRQTPYADTMRYTIHGPVVYDQHFPEPTGSGKMLAMSWMGHHESNELLSVYLYNRAGNYNEFVRAIQYFECPAQNFAYADKQGNIAIWGQGRFINKWKNQGKFVMRGDISATLWGDTIPMKENPHALNPAQQLLASANQQVTDRQYPYWYNGDFSEYRSWSIHQKLEQLDSLTRASISSTGTGILSMQQLQNDVHSILIQQVFSTIAERFPDLTREFPEIRWSALDGVLHAESPDASMLQYGWKYLYRNIWYDEFIQPEHIIFPSPEVTCRLILQDSNSRYFDIKHTQQQETLEDLVRLSLRQAKDSLLRAFGDAGTEWYKVKNTQITHLAQLPEFSYRNLKTGGWKNTINAMSEKHGPSWRMMVRMHPAGVKARVVYPGGQSGHPGSRHYSAFIDRWASGQYYDVQLR
jgi:penicillin amidase